MTNKTSAAAPADSQDHGDRPQQRQTRCALPGDGGRRDQSRDRQAPQIRRRFATEKEARAELSQTQGGVSAGTYVHASKLTVEQACEAWLASKHSLKPSTLRGHRVSLQPLRTNSAHRGSEAVEGRPGRPRRTVTPCRGRGSQEVVGAFGELPAVPGSAVLDDQMAQGHVVRNVAKLVDRVDGDAKTFRTLSERDMFRILDHESRERHLWALALYGLRRGEIAGLRRANVNLTDKTIGAGADALPARSVRIEENRVAVGKQIETGTPKSKASNRTLPMPDEVVDVLKAARSGRPKSDCASVRGSDRVSTSPATSRACPITPTC